MHVAEANKIMALSIVTPIKNGEYLPKFIALNKSYIQQHPLLVVDSGNGDALKPFASYYLKQNMPFWDARKLAYQQVQTDLTLNLDADVIIPDGYLEQAIEKLQTKNVAAISIFYEEVNHCQGALEYGVSIWKTNILKQLYDYSIEKTFTPKIVKVAPKVWSNLNNGWCECTYMWRKIKDAGFQLETLSMRAKHLHIYGKVNL